MPRRFDRKALIVPFALALAASPGCGGAPAASSSNQEVTVSGTIKAGGQPVAQGQVHFDPSNSHRKEAAVRTAAIGKDGTFTVTTLVGQNRIRVAGLASKRNQSFEEIGLDVQPGGGPLDIDLVPTQPRQRR